MILKQIFLGNQKNPRATLKAKTCPTQPVSCSSGNSGRSDSRSMLSLFPRFKMIPSFCDPIHTLFAGKHGIKCLFLPLSFIPSGNEGLTLAFCLFLFQGRPEEVHSEISPPSVRARRSLTVRSLQSCPLHYTLSTVTEQNHRIHLNLKKNHTHAVRRNRQWLLKLKFFFFIFIELNKLCIPSTV